MPPEFIEILKYLGSGAGFVGIFYLLVKTGLLKMQIGGNGMSDGNMKQLADKMRANHFHDWADDIKDIKDRVGNLESNVAQMKGEIGYLKGLINGR